MRVLVCEALIWKLIGVLSAREHTDTKKQPTMFGKIINVYEVPQANNSFVHLCFIVIKQKHTSKKKKREILAAVQRNAIEAIFNSINLLSLISLCTNVKKSKAKFVPEISYN